MSALADLAGVGVQVTVRGRAVTVTGLSARALVALLRRFPALADAIAGKGIDLNRLADLGPDVLAAVIAAGTGSVGDAAAEAAADTLPVADQLALVEAIASETFGGDAEGFLRRLESLAGGLEVQGKNG